MKVAINGFGRIGRQVLKIFYEKYPNIEVVAVNDLTENRILAHLLRHDSNYGVFDTSITATSKEIRVGGKAIKTFSEKEPANLPWKELGIDVVIEATGIFTNGTKAGGHLKAGAKKVIITAPGENVDRTIVLGVNQEAYQENDNIISMASCTTNCLAPMAKVILDHFGIEKGFMTTVHAYTTDQRILDLPHDDLRRARAAALNIIPTKTGAAKAIGSVIPELEGKLDGYAMRVPTPTVSIIDLVVQTKVDVTVEAANEAFKKVAEAEMKGLLTVNDENLVSTDFKGNAFSAIIDLPLTKVIGDNLLKAVGWYDNEWGYSNRICDLALYIGKRL